MIGGWFKSYGLGWHKVRAEQHGLEPDPRTGKPYEWITLWAVCGCLTSGPASQVSLRGTKAPEEAICEKCLAPTTTPHRPQASGQGTKGGRMNTQEPHPKERPTEDAQAQAQKWEWVREQLEQVGEDVLCFMCDERPARKYSSPTLSGPDQEGWYTILPMCGTCFMKGDLEAWVKAKKKKARAAK